MTLLFQIGITVAKLAITFGLDYDDVRDVVLGLCLVAAPLLGIDGPQLCGPVIDNYGPHVSI